MAIKRVKQDINFLQKPIWFQNPKHDGLGFVWKDGEYECRTGYKPPDKVDMLILLHILIKSQSNNYSSVVTTTRREILTSCDLPSRDNKYYLRVEDSLKRWKNIAIDFKGCFYEKGEYINVGFGILDDYEVDKKKRLVTVKINEKWLYKIKGSEYFKYINFNKYKALKRPISRRLHEILCKNFLSRKTWAIKLTKLGKNLTLTGRTKKDGTEVIYASDVLVAVKPAINEINKLTLNIELAEKAGIPAKDLFTITYEIRGQKQDRVIVFYCHPVVIEQSKTVEEKKETTNNNDLESIFLLLKKRTRKLEKTVKDYSEKHGTEYVRWNILYSNKTAKKNYSSYLQKALAENWAEEWAIEEKQRIEQEDKRQQEYEIEQQKKLQEEQQQQIAERQRPLFREALAKLKPEIKSKLWDQAYKEVPVDNMTRPMLLKIRFAELVLEYLNDKGETFIKKVINDFALVGSFELPE